MRIFLFGSKGFHTRVGSPSTRAAVGMGPVLVICLRSAEGFDDVVGAGAVVGEGEGDCGGRLIIVG